MGSRFAATRKRCAGRRAPLSGRGETSPTTLSEARKQPPELRIMESVDGARRRGFATVSQTELRWGKKCAEDERHRWCGGLREPERRHGSCRREEEGGSVGRGRCSPIPGRLKEPAPAPAWARQGEGRAYGRTARNTAWGPARETARRREGRRAARRRAD